MANERSLDEVVKEGVMRWQCIARTKDDAEALNRLAQHESARDSWRKLELKCEEKREGFQFEQLVKKISIATLRSHLLRRETKTRREIQDASADAAELAERLIRLIENNATLQRFTREEILRPLDLAALHRLNGALRAVRSEGTGNDEGWFSQEIEDKLDKVQKRHFPEYKDLTTSKAYRIVHVHPCRKMPQYFVEYLENFAVFARNAKNCQPVVSRPNAKNASSQAYGLRICDLLNFYLGSPNHNIAAGFVAAAFNIEVDTETVKKWWLRRGDIT